MSVKPQSIGADLQPTTIDPRPAYNTKLEVDLDTAGNGRALTSGTLIRTARIL